MQVLLQRIGTTSDATEKDSLALHFFFKFSAKTVLCVLGYIFNKVNRGIVQKPTAVGT